MRDDDEILEAYENEFEPAPEPDPARRSNRGFWLVTGFLGLACMLVLVLIAVNRPIKDTIAHAESTLRDSQSAAQRIHDETGSYANADATALGAVDPSNTYRGGGSASTGLSDISVATARGSWAAAVQARPEACFYLRLLDDGRIFYGVGTVCTGEVAMTATDPRW